MCPGASELLWGAQSWHGWAQRRELLPSWGPGSVSGPWALPGFPLVTNV